MTFNPAELEGLTDELVAYYAQAEAHLLAHIARSLAKGKPAPGWATAQVEEVRRLQTLVHTQVQDMNATGISMARTAILKGWTAGAAGAAKDITQLSGAAVTATGGISTHAINAILTETTGNLAAAHSSILRTTMDEYRAAVRDLSSLTLAGAANPQQMRQALLDRWAAKGITGFTDRAGRKWQLDSYAEMAVRTSTHRAALAAHNEQLIANGYDLVVVSAHPDPAPMCAPYERQVLSLTGKTPAGERELGGHTVTVKASMAAAEAAGLHHPNCGHTHTLYIPGTPVPEPEENPDHGRYNAKQRQRALERRVRAWKRKQAVATTPQAAAWSKQGLAKARKDLAAHVELHKLPRRPYRETPRTGKPDAALAQQAKAAELAAAHKAVLGPVPAPAKPAKAKAVLQPLDQLSPEGLETVRAKAQTKLSKSKDPMGTHAMDAQAANIAADYQQKLAQDPTLVPTIPQDRAMKAYEAAVAHSQAPTPSTKYKAWATKKDLKAALETDAKLKEAAAATAAKQAELQAAAEAMWAQNVQDMMSAPGTAWQGHLMAAERAWIEKATTPDAPVPLPSTLRGTDLTWGSPEHQLLVYKTTQNWGKYDPLKGEHAKALGISEVDLNAQVNENFGKAWGPLGDLSDHQTKALVAQLAKVEQDALESGLDQAGAAAAQAKVFDQIKQQLEEAKVKAAAAAKAKAEQEAIAAAAAEARRKLEEAKFKLTAEELQDAQLTQLAHMYVAGYHHSYQELLGTYATARGIRYPDANARVVMMAKELYEPDAPAFTSLVGHREAARSKLAAAAGDTPEPTVPTTTQQALDIIGLAATHKKVDGVAAMTSQYKRAETRLGKMKDPLATTAMQAQAEKITARRRILQLTGKAEDATQVELAAEHLLEMLELAKTDPTAKAKVTDAKRTLRARLLAADRMDSLPPMEVGPGGLMREKPPETGERGTRGNPVTFSSEQDGMNYAHPRWHWDRGDLPKDPSRAITKYTGNSYGPMNDAERLHKGQKPHDRTLRDNMDRAFQHQPPVPEWIQVTRGTDPIQFTKGHESEIFNMVGQEVEDHGWGSTSIAPEPAFGYKPVWMIIDVPPGARATYVSYGPKGSNAQPLSQVPRETELVLDRGSRYRVDRVERKMVRGSEKIMVHCTLVAQHTGRLVE